MNATGEIVPQTPAPVISGGIGFVGCEMMGAAPAARVAPHTHAHPHTGARRREVVVNGKRVKTIDVHAHCIVPGGDGGDQPSARGAGPADGRHLHARIAAMDAQGIDVEALSINPYWYRAARDAAAELIKIQNETLVEFCAANPDRFVAFATAALQHPDLAAEQVEHAVKKLGFRGVGVGGSVAGEELANPQIPSVLGEVRGTGRAGVHASDSARANWSPAAGSAAAGC